MENLKGQFQGPGEDEKLKKLVNANPGEESESELVGITQQAEKTKKSEIVQSSQTNCQTVLELSQKGEEKSRFPHSSLQQKKD